MKMKQMEVEIEGNNSAAKLKQALLLPRFWVATKPAVKAASVTNDEIAKFWKQKRMEEEDHLLAAIKAAARIRARKLTAEEYKRFEESLKEDTANNCSNTKKNENSTELHVGIKDWWTKSKYSYLNQPAIDRPPPPEHRTTATYIPNFCNYKLAAPPSTAAFVIF